jgi:copper(I)-binding protein
VPAPRSLVLLALATLLLTACGSGSDDGAVSADDVRSRMSPRMAGVAAVYLDLTNGTDQDDALVAASVPGEVAGRVELHETFDVEEGMDGDMATEEGMDGDMATEEGMDGDMATEEGMDGDTATEEGMGDDGMDDSAPMMGMREVAQIDLPAGETVRLEPGGLHIMLLDLVEDLEPGDTFELTLDLDNGDDLTVTVEVRDDV